MARFLAALLCAALAGSVQSGSAQAASPLADWSAVVVAGDWRAHGGAPSEAFDNARRDVTKALIRAGFQPQNVRQFSVRPERYKDTRPQKAELRTISHTMTQLYGQSSGGCLFYLTSHGDPSGAQLGGGGALRPAVLAGLLDETCGRRPTVVVISACFSGVFVPALAKSNRMVLTAARPDRSSFGCGQGDEYPYFDGCFLRAIEQTNDFAGLGLAVRDCVRDREIVEKVGPPSEPQFWVGAGLRPMLPLYPFEKHPAHAN